MARLSSQYDKEVGKVFVIRGDEAYARTTDSRVKVMASDRTDFNNYRCGLLCNVYRDRGESKITLYNGDIVVNQFDWSDNTEQMYIGMNSSHTAIDPDTCLELAWGVSHEIYIRYKGNNQCLPSKSKVLRIYEPLPDEFATNIAMTTTVDDTDVEVTVTIDINGVATVGTHDTDIEIYLDDEIVDPEHPTINTGDDNVASTTIQNISEGIHTITAIVVGTDSIHTATASTEVEIGSKVEITQYPQPFIIGNTNTILVKVTSFNGEPVSGGTVTFNSESYTTDNDGIATIELTNIESGIYHATYDGIDSNEVTIEVYSPSATIRAGTGIVSSDKKDTLYVTFSEPISGFPVTIGKRYRSSSSYISERTIHSGDDGIAVYTISGSGEGTLTYDAIISESLTLSQNIDDVLYYHNQTNQRWGTDNLVVSNGYIENNINGRIVSSNSNQDPVISFRGTKGNSWNLSFRVSTNYPTRYISVEVNSGEYYQIDETSSFFGSDCTVELRYDNGTLHIYSNGTRIRTITNSTSTGKIKIIDTDGGTTKRALFYNLKFVRTR